MYCAQCGNEIADRVRFCTQCGSSTGINVSGGTSSSPRFYLADVKAQISNKERSSSFKDAMDAIRSNSKRRILMIMTIALILSLLAGTAFGYGYLAKYVIDQNAPDGEITDPIDGSATYNVFSDSISPDEDVERHDDDVLPDSNALNYSKEELENLSDYELYLARNEIFARYGREFDNDDLKEYFNSKEWYEPIYEPSEFEAMYEGDEPLNDCEIANIRLISEIEAERNSPYLS